MFIDGLVVLLLCLAIIKGFRQGFIVAVFSFLALFIGLAAALKLSVVMASWLQMHTAIGARWLPFLSFALVMILVSLLVRIGAAFIQKTFELAMMGFINRLMGIFLYSVLYTIILSVVLFYTVQMHLINEKTLADSKFYGFIAPWGPKIIDLLGSVLPLFKDLFIQLQEFFDGIAKKATIS